MTKVFIEAKSRQTAEFHFLRTIVERFFFKKEVEFVCMNGIGHLYKEAILNQIRSAQENGGQVVVLADADTTAKGYGYIKRKAEFDKGMSLHGLSFPYFLYPDNQSDGDVEVLMETAARRDLHSCFFDCFEDYEKCVSGKKNALGEAMYNIPNRKGKLHTYMTAQKLPRKLRDRLGGGDWLFDEERFWDLDVAALQPLKDFLSSHLK